MLKVLWEDILRKLLWVVDHDAVALAVPRENRLVFGCLRVKIKGFSRLAKLRVFRGRAKAFLDVCPLTSFLLRHFAACCRF